EPSSLSTGVDYERIEIKIPRGSRQETVTYESASCRFRIEVAKVQDGWVNLRFVPEIHHGAQALRTVPTEQGWSYNERKNVDPIYSQQFTLMLHKGEIALMTATNDTPGSLGYAYFIGDGNDDRMQRVVVIRLEEVRTARPRLSREG
ncbi:MAG TPA: hypothetical protein VMM56_05120, partial [Planctomycetaceae bacterium]|nr:hypothetical protein [Planctomycetaceae bacterium]